MGERNVLGEPLVECGTDPVTGYYRSGSCVPSAGHLGGHSVCVVVTEEFLTHQREIGNDLATARPQLNFPGLEPGMRWCVLAHRWLESYRSGVIAPVVLGATHERALEVIDRATLQACAVDVPDDPGSLL
ncbi:MAG TPA: DUF2237 domain-containing protein [Beutenbergiaceae bacterium]|nr:DUF2237 domain-containing protein [Beutenbergiaceae bacterium]